MIRLRAPVAILATARTTPDDAPAPPEPRWLRSRARMSLAAWLAATALARLVGPGDHGAGLFLGVGDSGGAPDDVLRVVRAGRGPHGLDWSLLATAGAQQTHPLLAFQLMNHMTLCFASLLVGMRGPGLAVFSRDAAGFAPLLHAASALDDGAPVAFFGGADDPRHPVTAAERGPGGPPQAVWLRLGPVTGAHPAVVDGGLSGAGEASITPLRRAFAADHTVEVDVSLGAAGVSAALLAAVEATRAGAQRVWVHTAPIPRRLAGADLPGDGPAGFAAVTATPRPRPRPARRRDEVPVITAVGVVSACGSGLAALWAGLRSGSSALGPLTVLPRAPWPVSAAGEVPLPPTHPSASPAVLRDRKIAWALRALDQLGPLPPGAPVELALGLEQAFLEDLPAGFDALEARVPGHVRYRAPADLVAEAVRAAFAMVGPLTPHSAACAGGNVALAVAAERVARREAEVVLAGAADCLLAPLGVLGMARLGAPSPTGQCRPFDVARDGIVLAEGAAWFRVESLEGALARGTRPLAIVAGWGLSMDASSPSAPDPEGRGAASAMGAALERAGLAPSAIGWVKAHGTGTPTNDAAEALAIRAVLGPDVPVSSLKGVFGHALAAAGALEVAGALLAFAEDLLPGTVGCDQPDPSLGLDVVPPAGRAARIDALVANSFGFGGQNASVVLVRP